MHPQPFEQGSMRVSVFRFTYAVFPTQTASQQSFAAIVLKGAFFIASGNETVPSLFGIGTTNTGEQAHDAEINSSIGLYVFDNVVKP